MNPVQPTDPRPRAARSISRRTFLQILGAGAGMGLLAGCAPSTPAPSEPPAAPQGPAEPEQPASWEGGFLRPGGNPKRGGTLRTAFGVTTASFDLHQGGAAHVLCHMYNNLVRRNLVDGLRSVVPDLAESWEVSEDGKTYTFTLREGVKFHDGEPFSADDVVATFNRIINPPEGIISQFKNEFAMVESVEAVDARTVRFTLSAPRAYFVDLLAGTAFGIYSKKTLEEHNYDLREVIAPGTGAFRYVEYKTAEKWVLERNPDYWDSELPYIDTLEMLHVPAWSDRGTAVLTGQADMSWNVAFETWTEGENRPDIVQVNKLANFGAYWVLFNTKQPPFDDPRVRRAIHLAVSRQNLIKAFATQEQINLTRWVPYGDPYATPPEVIAQLPGYREDKTEDIETARGLLAEAGFADGITGVELLAASGPQAELLAPAFQDMLLRNLNIQADIRIIERSLLGQEEQAGNFQMVLDTYGHSISDISPRANLWWRTGGSQNWGGYSNPEFDALLDQIDNETDVEARRELIAQAQDLLDQDPPWFLIGYTFHLPMWRNTVKGLALDNRAFAEWGRIETVWLDV
ncbi:MAG: peptide ABC transporter substrate-binding protein [Litorilinea sp.]|nr:MAG: peptide ABC transporter substrate-binding protein [Litorilinea sp.]